MKEKEFDFMYWVIGLCPWANSGVLRKIIAGCMKDIDKRN